MGLHPRHAPGVTPETHPELDRLVGYAIRYFDDFVKPTKTFRAAGRGRARGAAKLSDALGALPAGADSEAIQNASLNVARKIERYQDHSKQSPEGGPACLVAFFQMIYQVLIGQERGPRFGSFAALYGIDKTRALIDQALAGGSWRLEESAVDRRARIRSRRLSAPVAWIGRHRSGMGGQPLSAAAEYAFLRGTWPCRRPRHRGRPRRRAPSRSRPATGRHPACRSGSRRAIDLAVALRRHFADHRAAARKARKTVRARTPHGQDLPASHGLVGPDDARCRRPRPVALRLDQASGRARPAGTALSLPFVRHLRPGRHGLRQLAQRVARLDTLKPFSGRSGGATNSRSTPLNVGRSRLWS